MRKLFMVTVAIVLAGCAHQKGFDRGDMKDMIGVAKPSFDDKAIKEAFNKKPNLPKPFRLAVYFKAPAKTFRGLDWRWTPEDKASLEAIADQLKKDGVVADVVPLVDAVIQGDDLRSLRLVAAKHQADALLIVSGAAEIDRFVTSWGWTYALIAPALFVKGSQADTLFLTSATMWDVRNEYLYLTAETEATTSDKYIAAFGKSDKQLVDEAKTKSLQSLSAELAKRVHGVKL